jgi:hypothetical protein
MEEIDQQSSVFSGRFFSCHRYTEYQAVLLVIWYTILFRQNRTDRPDASHPCRGVLPYLQNSLPGGDG